MLDLINKPLKNYEEFLHNDIESVKKYVLDFDKIKTQKKGLIIVGPTGVGKTLAVETIANLENYDLSINSADENRNKNSMSEFGKNIGQYSLFMNPKLILIENLEGFTKNDRGGISQLSKLIKTSKTPIIITTSLLDTIKHKDLKKVCKVIEFEKIPQEIIFKFLKENSKDVSKDTLKLISKKSNGDLRASIIDTYVNSVSNDNNKLFEYLERDNKELLKKIVEIILITNPIISRQVMQDVEAEVLISWIDENVASSKIDSNILYEIYKLLSLSTKTMSRIKRLQYWRLLSYVFNYISTISSYSTLKKLDLNLKEPNIGLKKWIAINKYAKDKQTAKILSEELNVSQDEIMDDFGLYSELLS